ncbi:MFS transporter [Streptomyces sp. TG1A-60]|uniref:MFS transporter n=1 Tax=Streptomyces sp. TG1A-60 TaxID=3129111 RepID=UPI0030CC4989
MSKPAVSHTLSVAVLAFGGIVAATMQTLVVPILGELPEILGTSASNASWVVTVTLLTAAVATPIAGRLGDQHGKRRMLIACTIPLCSGSVLAAVATSLPLMLVGRGLQGMGAGLVPLGISAMRDIMPPEKLNTAVALMSASLGIGGALGLPLAATVAQYGSWRALFWVSAVLSLVAAVLIRLILPVPASPGRAGSGFDFVGALGLSTGLAALLLAVSKGADWGWSSGMTLGLFGTATIVLLTWAWWELRTTEPMVDLRTMARPQVLLTNAASVVVGFSMMASSLIVPQLLQLPERTGHGLGKSMLVAGLVMAPGGFAMMAVAPVAGRISTKFGPKVTLLTGCLIVAAGYLASLYLMDSVATLMAVVIVISGGIGFAYGAMPALIMGAVPATETAAANGFNALMRSIGTSASSAVVGLVLSQMTVTIGPMSIPSEDGFRTGLLIGGLAALLAALITLAIPCRRPAEQPSTSTGVSAETSQIPTHVKESNS